MITDELAAAIWEPSGRGLLHLAASVADRDLNGVSHLALDFADKLGLDINLQDVQGVTPLMAAAGTQMGAFAYIKTPENNGLLQGSDFADRLQIWIDAGTDIHVKDDWGQTALHYAAFVPRVSSEAGMREEIATLPVMLKAGGDKNKVDLSGRTPLAWAIAEGNDLNAQYLRNWTTDTAAPEILSVKSGGAGMIGATITFDEALGSVKASDFLLVREDGVTAAAAIRSKRTLAGGNTQVEVVAADPRSLKGGHWRVYAVQGGVKDVAGNAYAKPPLTRGRNAMQAAGFSYLPGDADGSGTVDDADLAVVQRHMNSAGQGPAAGDLNGDGWVNLLDLAMVPQNAGKTLPATITGTFGGREPVRSISSDTVKPTATLAPDVVLDNPEPFDSAPDLAEEEPTAEPTPVVSEAPAAEPEAVVVEEPVNEPAPVVAEEPLVEPAPVAAGEPVVEFEPIVSQEPVTQPEVVVDDEPVVEPTPVVVAEPVAAPAPVVVEPAAEPVAPVATVELLDEPTPTTADEVASRDDVAAFPVIDMKPGVFANPAVQQVDVFGEDDEEEAVIEPTVLPASALPPGLAKQAAKGTPAAAHAAPFAKADKPAKAKPVSKGQAKKAAAAVADATSSRQAQFSYPPLRMTSVFNGKSLVADDDGLFD